MSIAPDHAHAHALPSSSHRRVLDMPLRLIRATRTSAKTQQAACISSEDELEMENWDKFLLELGKAPC